MTIQQACETWRTMSTSVTPESLNDVNRHQLVHDILAVVKQAIDRHEITYADFERMAAL